ncbi:MAG TPA: efflux RND transporter periplasmic adaptor subunit [Nitrospira sp.]|nr:efflux RND transporter periplasmic adaptor subunit [Nitrospira sp.]
MALLLLDPLGQRLLQDVEMEEGTIAGFMNTLSRMKQGGRDLSKNAGSALLIGLLALSLTHCKGETASAPPPPLLKVDVADVIQKDVPIQSEWVGTTDGMVNAVIRAQVTGYLMKRPYTEGSFVKKGDLLFELDPSKFRAILNQAQGDLAKAEAQLLKTKQDVERDTPLAKAGAVSQKELDDSIQANAAAKGNTASAKAAVEQAKLNLGWTRITAPIDGVVGIAKAQIGDLIDANSELTSMSTVDPIKVYFPLSEQEYLGAAEKVRERYKEMEKGQEYGGAQVELILSGERVYPHKGQFYLVDRQVDVKTGTIRVAALFPNPDNLLRPGQFARVRAVTKMREKALLVPQRAVTEMQGSYQVAVVTPENKVDIRPVKVGERAGNLWIIDKGLNPGERVVVEGLQKLKAGMTVEPKPFQETPDEKTT